LTATANHGSTVRQEALKDTGANNAQGTPSALSEVSLPIGWSGGAIGFVRDRSGENHFVSVSDLSPMYTGWLITAIMAILGAPFWVDTFQKLVGVKIPLLGSDKEAKG
jgi:hypothetical protein